MSRSKVLFTLMSALVLVAMLAAQCPGPAPAATPTTAPPPPTTKPGDTPVPTKAPPPPTAVPPTPTKAPAQLIIGTTDKVTVLDPSDSYDMHTWEIHAATMDTLLVYKPGTTDLMPGVAAAMPTVSADGLEYTFKIRANLKFNDGTPCDAAAVKWSMDRTLALKGDPVWLASDFVKEVVVVDPLTVKFVLKDAVAYFPLLVATPPYAPISAKSYPVDKWDADNTSGGVGVYKITKWTRDVEMILEANPNYYGAAPKTAKVIIKYFASATTMRLAVEKGDIDVAWKTLLPTDYVDLKKNDKLSVVEGPGPYIRYLCFNAQTAPFNNPIVREGISYLVDRDKIADKVFMGTHKSLYSMVPMGMWSHLDAAHKRDLAKGQELLAKAGFTKEKKLKMDLWYSPTHYGDTEADVAALMKAALEESGVIEVTLQNVEWATYKQYMKNGTMPVFLLGWYPDYLDPDDYTSPFAGTTGSKGMGIFYSNPDMDALLKKGQTEKEVYGDARKKVYEDIQNKWVTEAPTVPLFQGALLAVAQKNVQGIVLDPTMFLHYWTIYKQ